MRSKNEQSDDNGTNHASSSEPIAQTPISKNSTVFEYVIDSLFRPVLINEKLFALLEMGVNDHVFRILGINKFAA
jgi:hypothetical protein